MSPLRPTKGPGATPDPAAPNLRRTLADLLGRGGREHVTVTVPRTEVVGRMRLCSRYEVSALIAQMRAHFKSLDMPNDPATMFSIGLTSEWLNENAVRHLAIAVRDPNDESKPLASLDHWRELDDDQIATIWIKYLDLADRTDPLGPDSRLSDRDRADIEHALGKRNATVLMSYGSHKLSLYLLSTVDQPSSSPTQPSSPGTTPSPPS